MYLFISTNLVLHKREIKRHREGKTGEENVNFPKGCLPIKVGLSWGDRHETQGKGITVKKVSNSYNNILIYSNHRLQRLKAVDTIGNYSK